MTSRLWLIPISGAVLAPLITWLPVLAQRAPWLHLPPYDGAFGTDVWHGQAFYLVVYTIVAVLIGQRDRWLGLTLFMLGCGMFFWAGTMDPTHRLVFLMGALVLHAARHIPAHRRPLALSILSAMGAFQAAYVLQQYLGADLLWCPTIVGCGAPLATGVTDRPLLMGTIGTVDSASAYIAIAAPIMPWWTLPLTVSTVLMSHSIGAMIALGAGLLVRYHRSWWLTATVAAAMLGAATWAFAAIQNWHVPSTVTGRVVIAKLALWDLVHTDPLMQWQHANPLTGNGEWWPRVWELQKKYKTFPTGEAFQQAHNEYVQWVYTHGLLGAACLGGWLVAHRRMFLAGSGVGASLVAAAIVCGSFFVFQVVSVALFMIVLIGLATAFETPETTWTT